MTLSLEIISRAEWGAKKPKGVEFINKTAPYVIVHHSFAPAACYTKDKCIQAMKSMQNFHQNDRGWADIGYRLFQPIIER